MGKLIEQIILERSTNSQQKQEKMFNILGHQWNINQNDNEISSHPNQNGYHQEFILKKKRIQTNAGKDVGRKELLYT
jgi:hypothetical protein